MLEGGVADAVAAPTPYVAPRRITCCSSLGGSLGARVLSTCLVALGANRQQAIRSMSAVAMDGFELSDERVDALTDTCSVLTYRASARRGGHDYNVLLNGTYILDGNRWRPALHQ